MGKLTAVVLLLTSGCQDAVEGESFQADPTRRVAIEGFSLSFEIPAGFTETPLERGAVFAGPEGSREYFTPLIVQPRATRAALAVILDELTTPLLENPTFQLIRKEPIAVGAGLGLLYELSFDLHDAARRRLGVLIPTPGGVVDIALAANADRIEDALPVFDRALDSLLVTEREPRD